MRCFSPRDPRKKAANDREVSTAIRHDRPEAGKGRPRYWRGPAGVGWPYPRRDAYGPARANWCGGGAALCYSLVAASPRIAGVRRGYAPHTKRHAVAGWRHKRRVWQGGRADCLGRFRSATFRETLSSRKVALIDLPCTKNARRIFAIVSTFSIPTSASIIMEASADPPAPGVPIGCRDYPENGVLTPRVPPSTFGISTRRTGGGK